MDAVRSNPMARRAVRLIGSTWVGVGLIGAIVVYLWIASTVPEGLAAALGIELFSADDPVELYRFGPFVAACAALCVSLAVATIARVPLRWPNAGAWCSHLGVLILAGGSIWYTVGGFSGAASTMQGPRGRWTPIRHVYRSRSFAVYAIDPNGHVPVQTPLEGLIPHGPPRELNVPLRGAPDGVEIRATQFLPLARLTETWEDISANRIPAAQLRVADGSDDGLLVLSPSLPDRRQYGGRGYVMVYHAGLSKQALEKVITPTDANQGPGMPHDLALVVTGKEIAPTLAVIHPDGKRWHAALRVGEPLEAPLAGRKVRVELVRLFEHAAKGWKVEADASPGRPGHRHAGELVLPALKIDVRAGTWRRTIHLPHVAFEHVAPPLLVDLPGNRAIWLSFSRQRLPLPATLQVRRAEFQTYPASQIPKDYLCDVTVSAGGTERRETLGLNNPIHVGPYQFSQGSWQWDEAEPGRLLQIRLLAASRPGLGAIWLGCILICLGLPIAFYVKPLLLRRRAGR